MKQRLVSQFCVLGYILQQSADGVFAVVSDALYGADSVPFNQKLAHSEDLLFG
ncbi:MAG: hypothetical protein JRN37_06755 [Nitrososphaerota archaeon]|nr:hypothetical protein [Nitrososphaerota archaeon]